MQDKETQKMSLAENNLVVMHNALIRTQSNLTIYELKILRLAIMQVAFNDTDLKTYQVSLKDLAEFLNLDISNLYRDLRKIGKKLLKEIFETPTYDNTKGCMFQWCSCFKWDKGILTIKLNDELKPYLIALKGYYTQYMLSDILCLNSVYSIRLYELIREQIKYQTVKGKIKAKVILTVDDIRIATNTEKRYKQMGHFKKEIIDKPLAELNNKLDYIITYKSIKESRKIVAFEFKILSK